MARTYDYSSADDDVRILLSLVTDAVLEDDIVEYFIERVDNYIDSRLAKRYNVPFTQSTVPPVINDISANLAAYRVLKRLKLEIREEEQDYARTFYNDGMRMLKEIEEGKAEILDNDGNTIEPLSETGVVSSTSGYKPIFNEGDETGWGVSGDKVADEEDNY